MSTTIGTGFVLAARVVSSLIVMLAALFLSFFFLPMYLVFFGLVAWNLYRVTKWVIARVG